MARCSLIRSLDLAPKREHYNRNVSSNRTLICHECYRKGDHIRPDCTLRIGEMGLIPYYYYQLSRTELSPSKLLISKGKLVTPGVLRLKDGSAF